MASKKRVSSVLRKLMLRLWILVFISAAANADVVLERRAISYDDGTYSVEVLPRYVTSETPIDGPGDHAIATPGVSALGMNHDGVAQLQIDLFAGSNSVALCSGALLSTGRHVLTAAHCVTDSSGGVRVGTGDPNLAIFQTASGNQSLSFQAANVSVHPSFNGNVLNGYDVAVIQLDAVVADIVPRYDIMGPSAFAAADGSKFGYGRGGHGSQGDTVDMTGVPSTKRYGQNRYESVGLGALGVGGITNNDTQMTYDFDSGAAGEDAFRFFFPSAYAPDTGMGNGTEANSAPGDSGSPTFVDDDGTMKIAGVTSYGMSLAFSNGRTSDSVAGINSSFGEFSVDARVANASINEFITNATAVPEPSVLLSLSFLGIVLSLRSRFSLPKL